MSKKVEAIVIGWDGVLVDVLKNIHESYIEAFEAIKSPKAKTWTLKDTEKLQGKNPSSIFSDEILWEGKGDFARNAFYNTYDETNPVLKEGAEELMLLLCELDCFAAVVSAKSQLILQNEVRSSKISGYIDDVIGSLLGEPKRSKPAPGCWKRILDGITIKDPRQVLYIGKTSDKKFAESYGCEFIEVIGNGNALELVYNEVLKY